MRRSALIVLVATATALLGATPARAAAPTLGAVAATDIQGVSALLKGTVDSQGLPTTYAFQYVDEAGFAASGFTGAAETPSTAVGSGGGDRPARAAVSGLRPGTVYHYRLLAGNASGTTAGAPDTFATTQGFGFLSGASGFAATAYADGGEPAAKVGLHPNQLSLSLGFNQGGEFEGQPGVPFPDGDLRDLRVEMPPGLIANPNALAKCTLVQFHVPRDSPYETSRSGESCPDSTQVGTVEVQTSADGGQPLRFGLFNLEPAPGVPAQLGFAPFGTPITLSSAILPNPDGSYVFTIEASDFPQALDVSGLRLALWGTPWGASHDGERGSCLNEAEPTFPWAKCSVGEPLDKQPLAYLTLPFSCAEQLTFRASADAWQQPTPVSATATSPTPGEPPGLRDCLSLPFNPKPTAQLNNAKASSPSGFHFELTNDNLPLVDPAIRAPSPARRAIVTLPEGVTINPSVGAGLGSCSPGQYAAETAFSAQGAGCPNASKIGRFSVRTPLFEGLLDGAIYLAQPDDPATPAAGAENPFDSLIAVYLVARLPGRGVLIKVAGRIAANPGSGQLTATFDGLPQLPYTDLDLDFRAGQRAFLVTPPSCGAATARIELAPWTGSSSAASTTASPITAGINGGACPTGTPPFSPSVVAGGLNSNVNSYTPYFVHLKRRDDEQEIVSYSLVLPKGITGKLAGIPLCPNAAIEAARGRQGTAEAANPSCPAASAVGRTVTGYGVSSTLSYASGAIYLAGPYHGAPLSLVTINPATVGPFDLGTIVIRSAFDVDPLTAQLQIDSRASDPIPHILDGIPLHLRDVRIYMDRPQFTHNPSSCEASQLVSTLGGSGGRYEDSSDDTVAAATSFFQLLNCRTLGFRPRLGVRLRGPTRRGGYPQLRATFKARGPGDSNLKEIAVTIPHQEFLAQNHIRGICTLVEFAASNCPPNSVYGSAVAYTPLFDAPLRGDVYLRSAPGRRLPDLVADLHSGAIEIVLQGRIGPGKKGGIRARFSDLPDEPLDRFVMTLHGGKRGLLVNSANICAVPPVSSVKALGQNNVGAVFTTTLRGHCPGQRGKRHGKGGRK
jgi:hypothetical protein